MRRTMQLIGAALAIVGAVVLVASSGGTEAQGAGGRVVTVFEDAHGGTFRFIDNRPKSPVANPNSPRARLSLGDQAYFTSRLLDRQGGQRIGRVFGAETVMRGNRFPRVANAVHAIFKLSDGQIVVDAVVNEQHPAGVQAAVLGGTGAYVGARGTFTTTPTKSGNKDTITLLP